nr:MAG TPA: hypothetical protein [Caudoviricetes sp.]
MIVFGNSFIFCFVVGYGRKDNDFSGVRLRSVMRQEVGVLCKIIA